MVVLQVFVYFVVKVGGGVLVVDYLVWCFDLDGVMVSGYEKLCFFFSSLLQGFLQLGVVELGVGE